MTVTETMRPVVVVNVTWASSGTASSETSGSPSMVSRTGKGAATVSAARFAAIQNAAGSRW